MIASGRGLALVFAGQGAQFPGMGLDVLAKHPSLQNIVGIANRATAAPIDEIIAIGDARLHQTIYTQPAMLLASILLYEDIHAAVDLKPCAIAGFSVGEYAALYAAGVIELADVFRLIAVRAKAMDEAAGEHPGAMAAILGLDHAQIETICTMVSSGEKPVVIANYNCPGQIVISGQQEALAQAIDLCMLKGARRAMRLNVSGAFHSPLMHQASVTLANYLPSIGFATPRVPLYMNVTAEPLIYNDVRTLLAQQVESPVRFQQTIEHFRLAGVTHVLELGPGTVLAGLIRKTAPNIAVFSYQKTADIEALKGWLAEHE